MNISKYAISFLLLLLCNLSFAQKDGATAQKAILQGRVLDVNTMKGVELATVFIEETQKATETDIEGFFRIEIEANQKSTLVCRRIGYQESKQRIGSTPPGIVRKVEILLIDESLGIDIVVKDSRIKDLGMIREETSEIKLLPSVKLPLASSSQYNFDNCM